MKDPIVEKHLEDRLVKWDYLEGVPLDQFDEKLSLRNQARFEPLNDDTVARYTEAVERGDQFPAVVATRTKGGSLVLLDGNHRFQAHKKAKIDNLDVYVVTASPETLQVLTFEANSRHGLPPSIEERQRHAIYLIDNGASHEAAAASTGLTFVQARSAWNAERAERRARSLGITRGWNRLTKDQRERLAAISSDAGFVEAAKLTIDSRLSAADTRKLTVAMKNLRSDQAQVEQVKLMREQMREANAEPVEGRSMGTDARRACLPHLGYLIQMDVEAIANATITWAMAEDIQRRIGDAIAALELLKETVAAKHKES